MFSAQPEVIVNDEHILSLYLLKRFFGSFLIDAYEKTICGTW